MDEDRRVAWWRRWPLKVVAVLAVAGLLATTVQPIRVRLVAAATMAEALDLPVVRAFAASVQRHDTDVGGVRGDLYDPGPSAPGIVLVPGAAPRGRDDSRVVRLADAVARSGRAVFVPELEVYNEDLVLDDVDRIVRATMALSGPERGPAVLVGTSFGGSLGLLAAVDPRLEGRLALVATFGAYFDLVGVAQAVTTGVSLVGDREFEWEPHPLAEGIVADQLVALLPPGERSAVRDALDGDRHPDILTPAGRAVRALLTNDDPARTFALAADLPEDVRERLSAVSPSSVADRLTVPIVAMHSTDDPAIPYGELVRLGTDVPHATRITLDRFLHVDIDLSSPGSWVDAIGDLRRVWRFATMVLDAQDGG